MKKGTNTKTFSGARGTKGVVSTGRDDSSLGETGMKSLNPKMGGGRHNLGHSIEGATSNKGSK